MKKINLKRQFWIRQLYIVFNNSELIMKLLLKCILQILLFLNKLTTLFEQMTMKVYLFKRQIEIFLKNIWKSIFIMLLYLIDFM